MRLIRRLIPWTNRFKGSRFFTVENSKCVATPMAIGLILIEVTDVVFAVDSIPAVFAITADPFIVFTSNVLALLGMRSLFFVIAGAVQKLVYLKLALAAILVFVGAKMMVANVLKIPLAVSLALIAAILGVSIVASLLRTASPGSGFGRVLTLIAGWVLVVVGVALLILPGPGIPVLLGGLGLLARQYSWAKRAVQWVNERAKRWLRKWKGRSASASQGLRASDDRSANRGAMERDVQ